MNLDTQSLQPNINFIWTITDDVLINKYLENQYQDVIYGDNCLLPKGFMAKNNVHKKQRFLVYEKTTCTKNNAQQIQSLKKTRDTLLPKLMSGELRVK